MTFNSADSVASDKYNAYSLHRNSDRNTTFDLNTAKVNIKDIQKEWDDNNSKYSLVGMINAEYLHDKVENWTEDLDARSNESQFCRIWWKTTKENTYALFPKMWNKRGVGLTKIGNENSPLLKVWKYTNTRGANQPAGDSESVEQSLNDYDGSKDGGQLYMYNTKLSESIGDASGENIFKHYMNDFVFSFGEPGTADLYITGKPETNTANYTYLTKSYKVVLTILASLKYSFGQLNSITNFNNLIESGLNELNAPENMKQLITFNIDKNFE
jgi:hypothetical protein